MRSQDRSSKSRANPAGSAGDAREQLVSHAFVELADTLVDDFDIIDLLDRLVAHCTELLDADAGAIMLVDDHAQLRVVASSSDDAELMDLLQLDAGEGPCVDCFQTIAQVSVPDLAAAADRWPRFVAAVARRADSEHDVYRAVHAIPLRLRGRAIGALNLFHRETHVLATADARLAQAMADIATIGILSERAIRHGTVLGEQLQTALSSRVVIEQAKGVLAERGRLDMDTAFDRLRRHARANNLRLSTLARDIVTAPQGSDLSALVLATPAAARR